MFPYTAFFFGYSVLYTVCSVRCELNIEIFSCISSCEILPWKLFVYCYGSLLKCCTHLNWYENIIILSLVRHYTIYMTISSKFCLSVCGSAISHNLTRIHRTIYWLLMCTMCQANLFINYSFKVPPLSPNAFTPFFFIAP